MRNTTHKLRRPKGTPIRNNNEKTGRNDPCPCGSGKKYKKCHLMVQQKHEEDMRRQQYQRQLDELHRRLLEKFPSFKTRKVFNFFHGKGTSITLDNDPDASSIQIATHRLDDKEGPIWTDITDVIQWELKGREISVTEDVAKKVFSEDTSIFVAYNKLEGDRDAGTD